ncbi:Endoplasmic oxidoreductin-1 [Scedosporium apiospermum]|uniref:Endoplasmic oxidoreductin-1 n=1 Tax=Pseudallescheria apiosperma TaxID=563466 RepID=A0A084G4S5_PSEDA|nr:Endoplasmic oxidoreductin-1 [Scedosporium apiospermum]KEZ42337.1 Endoplasmic oxidoreductin-1 [Scedosporium apiospermum]
MRPPSKLLCLTILTSWTAQVRCAADASEDACPISPKAIVSDACASYATLERLNTQVKPAIDDLTKTTDFFSHYRVNLFHKGCPFWNDENGMCGNRACAVATLDNEEDIPEVWRAEELSKLEGPRAKHPNRSVQIQRPEKPLGGDLGEDVGESCVVEYDDECDERDYCVPEDESATSKGDYVSLLQNPERFTGYAGDGAKQVWDAIYRENCFQTSSFPKSSQPGVSDWTPKGPAAFDFKHVLEVAGRQHALEQKRQENPNTPFVSQTGLELEDQCIEKRVFYRVISGMHASISTHLCWDFLNQTTGEWTPNVACYENRLHKFPDRISNLYFNYALVTRAIAKLGPYLQDPDYVFCTGDKQQDAETKAKIRAVTDAASSVPQIFDESLMFKNGEGPSLKEDFRNRFRNVSRLMDCVGCDKCRLWGKLQTAGYGTALKVLFEFDNESNEIPRLKRTELVALFNTYARVSSSLNAIGQFRAMVEKPQSPEDAVSWTVDPSLEDESTHGNAVEPETDLYEGVKEDAREKPKSKQERTIRDEFDLEFARVWKAFKIVIGSWIRLPGLLWNILKSELSRLYEFYVGLPVSPRIWTIKFPRPDEL